MKSEPTTEGRLPDGRSFRLIPASPSPGSPRFGAERIELAGGGGQVEEMALHEYDKVYSVPGLYEAVVQEALDCRSPGITAEHAADAVRDAGYQPGDVRVLDVGAGNGVVGTELAGLGFRAMLGTDLVPEAEEATLRDRPGLYEHFVTGDLADPDDPVHREIAAWGPTVMTCAGALGGGHMQTVALSRALDALAEPGLAVMTIGEDRLDQTSEEGLGAFLEEQAAEGALEELRRERFRHRLSMAGEPVQYLALTLRVRS